MYKNKLEELLNFLELLRCKSYDEVYLLKKRIGVETFRKLEERYELLRNEDDNNIIGSSLEVLEQERTIDLSHLTKNKELEELYFILRVLLCTDVNKLKNIEIPTENYFLVQLYQDYIQFLNSEHIKKTPILLNIKVTSFI